MATNEVKIPIPARLYNASEGGHVAGADQIIDDETGLTLDKVTGGALEEKEYTSGSNNGMGRVVLRKNLVEGVNTLTQTMINKSNTIYVIQYDFTLASDVTIPANCVLEFEGGSISNGTLIGEFSIDAGAYQIFNNIEFIKGQSNIKVDYIPVEWFGAKGDYSYTTHTGTDDSDAITEALKAAMITNVRKVKLSSCCYYIDKGISIHSGSIIFEGTYAKRFEGQRLYAEDIDYYTYDNTSRLIASANCNSILTFESDYVRDITIKRIDFYNPCVPNEHSSTSYDNGNYTCICFSWKSEFSGPPRPITIKECCFLGFHYVFLNNAPNLAYNIGWLTFDSCAFSKNDTIIKFMPSTDNWYYIYNNLSFGLYFTNNECGGNGQIMDVFVINRAVIIKDNNFEFQSNILLNGDANTMPHVKLNVRDGVLIEITGNYHESVDTGDNLYEINMLETYSTKAPINIRMLGNEVHNSTQMYNEVKLVGSTIFRDKPSCIAAIRECDMGLELHGIMQLLFPTGFPTKPFKVKFADDAKVQLSFNALFAVENNSNVTQYIAMNPEYVITNMKVVNQELYHKADSESQMTALQGFTLDSEKKHYIVIASKVMDYGTDAAHILETTDFQHSATRTRLFPWCNYVYNMSVFAISGEISSPLVLYQNSNAYIKDSHFMIIEKTGDMLELSEIKPQFNGMNQCLHNVLSQIDNPQRGLMVLTQTNTAKYIEVFDGANWSKVELTNG